MFITPDEQDALIVTQNSNNSGYYKTCCYSAELDDFTAPISNNDWERTVKSWNLTETTTVAQSFKDRVESHVNP
jgi:hypothetical protein